MYICTFSYRNMLVTFDESQVIIDQYPIDEASCFSDRNSV